MSDTIRETSSIIKIDILHASFPEKRWAELRFNPNITIRELKKKLYHNTGTRPDVMKISLESFTGEEMIDANSTLISCGIRDKMTLYVVDTSNELNQIFDENAFLESREYQDKQPSKNILESVQKTKLTIAQMRENMKKQELTNSVTNSNTFEIPGEPRLGDFCQILAFGGVKGEIVYIGNRDDTEGKWIGVRLDEPIGNDKYIVPNCKTKYGCYIPHKNWDSYIILI